MGNIGRGGQISRAPRDLQEPPHAHGKCRDGKRDPYSCVVPKSDRHAMASRAFDNKSGWQSIREPSGCGKRGSHREREPGAMRVRERRYEAGEQHDRRHVADGIGEDGRRRRQPRDRVQPERREQAEEPAIDAGPLRPTYDDEQAGKRASTGPSRSRRTPSSAKRGGSPRASQHRPPRPARYRSRPQSRPASRQRRRPP